LFLTTGTFEAFCSRRVRMRAIMVRFGDVKIAGTDTRLENFRRYFVARL